MVQRGGGGFYTPFPPPDIFTYIYGVNYKLWSGDRLLKDDIITWVTSLFGNLQTNDLCQRKSRDQVYDILDQLYLSRYIPSVFNINRLNFLRIEIIHNFVECEKVFSFCFCLFLVEFVFFIKACCYWPMNVGNGFI